MPYPNSGRLAARMLPAALALMLSAGAPAQEVRLLVQRSPLAGFRYYDAPKLFDQLRPGQALSLVREPENPHDPNAVRVEWRGHKLGYVPRRQNGALAWALDRGQTLEAAVAERRLHPNPRRRVEFDVFAR